MARFQPRRNAYLPAFASVFRFFGSTGGRNLHEIKASPRSACEELKNDLSKSRAYSTDFGTKEYSWRASSPLSIPSLPGFRPHKTSALRGRRPSPANCGERRFHPERSLTASSPLQFLNPLLSPT